MSPSTMINYLRLPSVYKSSKTISIYACKLLVFASISLQNSHSTKGTYPVEITTFLKTRANHDKKVV
jgi:hypothetical protein